MRISIEKGDPGYDPAACCLEIEIFVDGCLVANAVTADDEQGYVKCYDARPSKGGQLIEMHGKVEIRGL